MNKMTSIFLIIIGDILAGIGIPSFLLYPIALISLPTSLLLSLAGTIMFLVGYLGYETRRDKNNIT